MLTSCCLEAMSLHIAVNGSLSRDSDICTDEAAVLGGNCHL